MATEFRLSEIARLVSGELVGDDDVRITGVSTFDRAGAGDLVFIDDPDKLSLADVSAAAAVLAPRSAHSHLKPTIVTEDPKLAFSRILELFAPEPSVEIGVHPTAIVAESATLGHGVAIGPYAVVEDGVRLGDGAVVYPFAFVGRESDIGEKTILWPHVYVGERVTIGKRCRIHAGTSLGADGFGYLSTREGHRKIPQIGTVVIEDDVEIGANCSVDRATVTVTRIGAGTKIDDQVHVAHNCDIGRCCLLCGQVGIAGSTTLGDFVVMGGQAGVADHADIASGTTIAAAAGVIGNIREPGIYSGFPARPHTHQLRVLATEQKLPEMAARMKEMERQIAELQRRLDGAVRAEKRAKDDRPD
jgi:UDP-3-O-[3-hydroxymyristoyl] glucosamine N-acyltransferase